MKRTFLSLLIIVTITTSLRAQGPVDKRLLTGSWPASWITCPQAEQRGYGVYHFRKTIELAKVPASFNVHLSADNRYRLFVNGRAVCSGPARGDLYNWNFETVDLAPYLHTGPNIIAALVWNMGEHAPVAQVSNQTGWLMQGDTEAEYMVNTNSSWKVYNDKAYTPCSLDNGARLHSYMVIGPGDQVRGNAYPWNWEQADYNDSQWLPARGVTHPVPAGYGSDNLWTLTPRTIPLMEEVPESISIIRRTRGIDADTQWLSGRRSLEVPAHSTASILLDQAHNTVAYPQLTVSKGNGSSIRLTYAEALLRNGQKGNRDEADGREIVGNYDIFEPDGGNQRTFRPLWVRTYRYLQLDITTGNEPLQLNRLYGMRTGYPFEEKASFSSNDRSLTAIWETGWRTARLCAGETYFDCPYYEQLQYEGDTRIQSLISLYVAGDDRLMRKAIHDFYCSRVPEGLTQGRYPSSRLQVIPPFSLYWVTMLYDYWMHRKDDAFLRQYLTAATGVLDWYENHIDRSRMMLGAMPWWGFIDWNTSFPGGVPDGATNGHSAVITLQYVYTLQQAAALFGGFGRTTEAQHYAQLAQQLAASVYRQCFDASHYAMANTPEKKSFSQHAGIMAVLTGAVPAGQSRQVLQRVITDSTISQATFYYRFYLTQAMKKAGMAELYYSQLQPWRDMLKIGLTTFAENPEPTRSDCHAWSASPNYDFLATICGIMPAQPGFARVKIAPAPGALEEVNGTMPHPQGNITVSLKRKEKRITGTVILPKGLTGDFIWGNKKAPLKEGETAISL
ncbi:MAG TPA: alpha-L-rhamnosidase C-terminal domain-containing protein [Chitinophaga sp.]|uniref:alpha-L-rhamnosidase-related protein n=1 Tax=Chitinophaga sp. TaxID=1869181 RepID=UPI002D05F776|nr:alpha-L-rhamnosidase C-terminal domain-containing protein [Chitinophaga sp.]HVI45769.1 alpha-L-rhamnosidase C-terminal domain-containing protein [Chitinophaga sp.]